MSWREPSNVLTEMTWREAAAALARQPVGLLPIGAIEAHGPHLPLDSDVIIADATARRAARRLLSSNVPALVLPPVWYGVSYVGRSFAGTSPVDPAAFEAHLRSVLINHLEAGCRAIVICNAHLEPEHVARVRAACAAAESHAARPVLFPDQREEPYAAHLSAEFRAGARHAGSYETAIIMAARPSAVRDDIRRTLPPVWIDLPAQLRAGARSFAEAGATDAYFGDPAAATVDEGERLLDALAHIVMLACAERGLAPVDG